MNQRERRLFLIDYLKNENRIYEDIEIPVDDNAQKILLRSLINVRPASDISESFIKVQDEYLKNAIAETGITEADELMETERGICLWKGDITTLRAEAVVNAANSGLTGCYKQNHRCIDNCIHTFAGVQLRKFCYDIIEEQGFEEPSGQAKITPAFNLPSRYIIHTVGPSVRIELNENHMRTLENCYRSCFMAALERKLSTIAFCCIGTGEYMFPKQRAAEIAVRTVRECLDSCGYRLRVIFDVFTDEDMEIYRKILGNQ